MTTKLYYRDGNRCLNGYTLYLPINKIYKGTLPDYCITSDTAGWLSMPENICDTSIGILPKGSSVYVFPDCKYASEDIRNHYKVKRDADTADYNVYNPIDLHKSWYLTHTHVETILYWPERFVAVGSNVERRDLDELSKDILKFVPDMSEDDVANYRILFRDSFRTLYWPRDPKNMYMKVMDGAFKRPLVASEQLDITNENRLTADVLMLVYHTVYNTSRCDDKSNIVAQLNMLNQYDWRNYPGTISVFTAILSCKSAFYQMQRQHSKYNKVINEFLAAKDACFTRQEDLELAQTFLYNLMEFDGVRFIRASDMLKRLDKFGIKEDVFEKVFDAVVKISPKKIG